MQRKPTRTYNDHLRTVQLRQEKKSQGSELGRSSLDPAYDRPILLALQATFGTTMLGRKTT
jgi:hypothetical protein